MAEIEFFPCSKKDLKKYKEKYNLKLSWVMVGEVQKAKLKGRYIGLIDISPGMYGDTSVHIDNFEVFKKGKGRGTKMLHAMIKELPGQTLYLYAYDDDSKLFWEKNKFIAKDDGTGTPIHYYVVPE